MTRCRIRSPAPPSLKKTRHTSANRAGRPAGGDTKQKESPAAGSRGCAWAFRSAGGMPERLLLLCRFYFVGPLTPIPPVLRTAGIIDGLETFERERIWGRSRKTELSLPAAAPAAEHSPSQTNDADSGARPRIPPGVMHFEAAVSSRYASPGGTQRAAKVPGNYHSNLLALTGLPTIKRYELPSALILPG